ncbi:MAG: ABC transporter ATP-binding protein [Rhodopseudomonas palustris]|uniref:ABC transporter ATP-binding protein n=1 Tax=Rhodopseudomonas palustris TaxID=1076 RepID=A0A933S223_RHOPL|nr:ABC transporter ATP-binding protein [Rhodopseudomonas palustris]
MAVRTTFGRTATFGRLTLVDNALLEIDGIDAFYGRSQALFGVTFSVGRNEVVAVVGRNGAGKTTTLRSIMGLTRVRTGTISFGSSRIDRLKAHQIARAGISYVPETRDPFSLLTVEENIMLGYRSGSPYDLKRVVEWFPDLAGLMHRRGSELSGGQQQMMVIGRGLTPGPRLLLLDEPSQGLAPVIVKKVGETLSALRKEDLSVILVEQNLEFALSLADRVVVLENGSVVDQLSAAEGRQSPERIERYLGIH